MADGSVSTLTNPVTGTGSAGQVAYFNGTSSITGESNLFWDATNDRLGIGITNPTTALHVNGLAQIVESGNTAFYGGNYVRVFNNQNFNIRNKIVKIVSDIEDKESIDQQNLPELLTILIEEIDFCINQLAK
jgi:hypothetical protein